MSNTLYFQTDKNVQVKNSHVYLQDIARLTSNDSAVLARNKVRRIMTLPENKPGRYVISVIDIIKQIQEQEQNVDVTHIGEPTVVITYEKENHKGPITAWLKTAVVCLITFFGAAFAIMTFNTDVDAPGLFTQIYYQFTGKVSNGYTILELMYSIGIGIGVIVYFNHLGKTKITQDPTPMEVEMRLYEEEIDKTIVEKSNSMRTSSCSNQKS